MKRILSLLGVVASVLFALKATAEIQITNEFWICNSTNTANLGTLDNPYDGSTHAKFDAIMIAMPPYSTIHILAGTYETAGSGDNGEWHVQSGEKIIGSGIDNTILRLASGTAAGAPIISIATCCGGFVTNAEVSDLTCDCNWTNGHTSTGVNLFGTRNAVRRVKVINCGYTPGVSSEAFAISVNGFGASPSEGNIIEECEVDPLIGGHNITAINLSDCSGIVRNNRVYLSPDPVGAQIALNEAWAKNSLFEGNYVEGADSGFVSDTGGATNIIFAHNIFKNIYCGFVFWNNPREGLTFDFNKILLTPTGSYFSTAFGFPDGTYHTNIIIIGNDVEFDGTPSRSAYFLSITNVVGLTIADNTVDSRLNNFLSADGLNMFNNFDLNGNYLDAINIPTVGGVDVSPLGLNLISSAEISSALTNLGLPSNPAAVITNNETGVTLSGTFSGNGSGLTNLNASQLNSGTVPLANLPGTVVTNILLTPLCFGTMDHANAGVYYLTNSFGCTMTNAAGGAVGIQFTGRQPKNAYYVVAGLGVGFITYTNGFTFNVGTSTPSNFCFVVFSQ